MIKDKTPYEIWYKKKPRIDYFKIFGCKAVAHVPKVNRAKFDPKGKIYRFIGYSENSKVFRLLDQENNKVIIRRDVSFLENDFFNQENKTTNHKEKFIYESLDDDLMNERVDNLSIDAPVDESVVADGNQEISVDVNIDSSQETFMDASIGGEYESIGTESSPKVNLISDPCTYRDAIKTKERRNWLNAMSDEIEEMKNHNAWTLVQMPLDKNVIDSRWVFKTKYDYNSNTKRFRARLVAKEFNQEPGIDYDQVFAPVGSKITFRLFLSICTNLKIGIIHLDIKTAFLNGELEEELYMYQPEGFSKNDNLVCKLNKAIYGLKQAAKSWNNKLNEFLVENDFKRNSYDQCLYAKNIDENIILVLVYVDDILVSGTDEKRIIKFIGSVEACFKVRNMGNVKEFLGIEIERTTDFGFLIHQRQYIDKILNEFGMNQSKFSKIPIDPSYLKLEDVTETLPNNKHYQKAIGSLLYLSINTRPDIALAVSVLGRKASCPSQRDWHEVKKLFK